MPLKLNRMTEESRKIKFQTLLNSRNMKIPVTIKLQKYKSPELENSRFRN